MKNVGRYKPLRQIATGGMADIFLAEQRGAKGFRKRVVLKKIRPEFSANEHFLNMLVDEAHIAMGFNHGNLVHVLDFGQAAKTYYLVLELVDGWSLDHLVRRARSAKLPIPPQVALYIVAEVCRGLAYAHGFTRDGEPLGIVHRDVSTHNVLLSEQGEVKLSDFGIALAREKLERTATGVVKGKLAFFSPEQSHGRSIDARSDLFSLGIVLYYLLADALPFQAPTGLETVLKIRSGNYQPLGKARPQLDSKVVKLATRALKTKPADRFQSAEEMLAEIERVLRACFPPTGRTELKQYLAALAAKDGGRPVGKDPEGAEAVAAAKLPPEEEIELVSDQDIVPPTLPPQKNRKGEPPPPPLEPPQFPDESVDLGESVEADREGAPALVQQEIRPALVLDPPPPPRRGSRWPRAVGFLLLVGGVGLVASRPELRERAQRLLAGPGGDGDALVVGVDAGAAEGPTRPPVPDVALSEVVAVAQVPEVPAPDPSVDAGSAAEGGPAFTDGGELAAVFDDAGVPLVQAVTEAEASEAVSPPPMVEAPAAPESVTAPTSGRPRAAVPAPVRSRATAPSTHHAGGDRVDGDRVVVRVNTQPPGAMVRVENRDLGRTPVSLKFRSGILFELTFVKEGYVPTKRRIQFTSRADQKVWASLKRR